jgi:hypothetical protein
VGRVLRHAPLRYRRRPIEHLPCVCTLRERVRRTANGADARERIDRAIANGSDDISVLTLRRIGPFDEPKADDTLRETFADPVAYVDDRDEAVEVTTPSKL